jgi:hypothetical protein
MTHVCYTGGKTLLESIRVPVPSLDAQLDFERLLTLANTVATAEIAADTELDALLPSVLDRAFRGGLSPLPRPLSLRGEGSGGAYRARGAGGWSSCAGEWG